MTPKKLVEDWFFERGDAARSFDASHPITQDLMKDEGVKKAKENWEKSGKPETHNYYYSFNIPEYLRETVTLDGTGSTLGSYDVHMQKTKDGRVRYDMYNDTGWESGTRMPRQIGTSNNESIENMIRGTAPFNHKIKSILNNRERSEDGPGGKFRQHYYWYE